MDTTNEGFKESMPAFKKLILVVLLVGLALAIFFGVSKFNDSPPAPEIAFAAPASAPVLATKQSPPANAKNALPTGVVNNAAAQTDPDSKVTYRPDLIRPIRKIEGDLYNEARNSNRRWWLYATTEEDAQWLDRYGFPTPAEEERLEAASDADLTALVTLGDQNAKVHLATRAAKRAVMSESERDMNIASAGLHSAMYTGGPYQALMVMKSVQDMLYAYDRSPKTQQTNAQRKALEEFSHAQIIAEALGTAHGDINFLVIGKQGRRGPQFVEEFQPKKELSAEAYVEGIAIIAKQRSYAGTPLTIVPRPVSNYRVPVIFERY